MKKLIKYILSFENIIAIFFIVLFGLLLIRIEPVNNSVYSIISGIAIDKVIIVIISSFVIAIFSAFFIIDILEIIFHLKIDSLFLIAYLFFAISLGFGLLKVLTESQFNLLSAFIAFPLFLIFPKLFEKIVNNRKINQKDNKNQK
ncbi:TPA: hypothetical protein ACG672_001813 [Streptococcus agalactiae]